MRSHDFGRTTQTALQSSPTWVHLTIAQRALRSTSRGRISSSHLRAISASEK